MTSTSRLWAWRRCVSLALPALLSAFGLAQGPTLRTGNPTRLGFSDASAATLRDALAERVRNSELAGASLLIARQGEIIFREACGSLDPDSAVRSDGMTLPILGTALLLAADRGLLTIDDRVADHLPEYRDTPSGNLRLRDLLRRAPTTRMREEPEGPTHRSPRSAGGTRTRPAPTQRARRPQSESDRDTRGPDPVVLACRVLQTATGSPWDDWITRSLFRSVGMQHARFVTQDLPRERLRDVGLEVTLEDLAAYAQMHLCRGVCSGSRFLSETAIAVQQGTEVDPGRRRTAASLGFLGDHSGLAGAARTLTAFGDGGSATWIDFDRETVAVLFTKPGTVRGTPVVPQIQALLRRAFGSTEPGAIPTFESAGPWITSSDQIAVRTAHESREIPVTVIAPQSRDVCPVVLVLDADEGDDAGSTNILLGLLAEHWASHGFVVVRCAEPRELRPHRPEQLVPGRALTEAPQRDLLALDDRYGDLRNGPRTARFVEGAQDISTLLDAIATVQSKVANLTGRLDTAHIAVVGCHGGAVTALALGGMTMTADGRNVVAVDSRVNCVVALDAPGLVGCATTPAGLAQLRAPALFVTRDDCRRAGSAEVVQREAFAFAPPGDRFLLAFTRSPPSREDDEPPLEPGRTEFVDDSDSVEESRSILLSTTTAFLDSILRESESTHRWLRAGGLTTGTPTWLEWK